VICGIQCGKAADESFGAAISKPERNKQLSVKNPEAVEQGGGAAGPK
jgi:hypothetical protein